MRRIVSTTTGRTQHVLITSAMTYLVDEFECAFEFCMPCTTWGMRSNQHPPASTVNNVAPRRSTRWGCRGQPETTLHTANSSRVTWSRASEHPKHHHESTGATGRSRRSQSHPILPDRGMTTPPLETSRGFCAARRPSILRYPLLRTTICGLWVAGGFVPHRSQMRVGAHNHGTQCKAGARGDWWCARGCAILKKGPTADPPERGLGILLRSKKKDTQKVPPIWVISGWSPSPCGSLAPQPLHWWFGIFPA